MEAEEEKLLEHAKNAVHALTDKKQKWTKKIGSFLLEILVIVIAVNLTIWFHNWNDKKHERQLEKEFLTNIRGSLVQDTINIRYFVSFMTNSIIDYYDSALSQIDKNKTDAQYLDTNSMLLIRNTRVEFDYSLYQSFSSAGNLRLIENPKLLNDIMFIYSDGLPHIQKNIEDLHTMRSDGFNKYVGYKIGVERNGLFKISTIIHQPEIKYLIYFGGLTIREVNSHCEYLLDQISNAINDIDKELKERFKQ